MIKKPPYHPKWKLLGTEKMERDIAILILDYETNLPAYYYQNQLHNIRDKELKEYLFSVRRYINEGNYDLEELEKFVAPAD